ncbi:MAG: TrbG/VirB9 family P-type conjugative transfer protein [Gammaproteobacteria bacterium]
MSAAQKSAVCALAFVGMFSLPLRAEVLPLPVAEGDSRIRSAAYNENQVYRLFGYVGYDIRLEFAEGETFQSVDGGDLDALTYSADGNVFRFKPRARSVDTNLAVTTNKRHYYIQYSAEATRPEEGGAPVIYVVRFVYPPDPTRDSGPSAAERIEQALERAPASRTRNFDYGYCGSRSIKPTAAFDDGAQTHLKFGARAELPAIFVRNDDGSEGLINFTVEGDDVVVHRVARQFVLRRGRLTGCIVNRSFTGSGTRLESGTVSGDVERSTKAPRP